MDNNKNPIEQQVCDWWKTAIIEMSPGKINYYGHPIASLIGELSFSQMIWLMLRGERPSQRQTDLLDAVLMSAVDHGPQAPSIAIARMAATCGVGINNAMASALNALGDVHGGAGQQALEFYNSIKARIDSGHSVKHATTEQLTLFFESGGKYLPGFGHRFHPVDPRSPALLKLAEQAADDGIISRDFITIGCTVEQQLAEHKQKTIPMNIDGATAVIYGALGFSPEQARGLFCLSRSVGILAHTIEERKSGLRNKGPLPKNMIWSYEKASKKDSRTKP